MGFFPVLTDIFPLLTRDLLKKIDIFAASKQQINIYKQFKTLRIWKKKRKKIEQEQQLEEANGGQGPIIYTHSNKYGVVRTKRRFGEK